MTTTRDCFLFQVFLNLESSSIVLSFLARFFPVKLSLTRMRELAAAAASLLLCCVVDAISTYEKSDAMNSAESPCATPSCDTPGFPGTSEKRLQTIVRKVMLLDEQMDLQDSWVNIRRKLLQAGGLRHDLRETSHAFNDWNHCDLTPMKRSTFDFENEGRVRGMNPRNQLGQVIRKCSLTKEDDPDFDDDGGSWSTCLMNCNLEPPRDVAHVQFQSKIAFKLVWLPPTFDKFALVGDDGAVLKIGTNLDKHVPHISERQMNFEAVHGRDSRFTKHLRHLFS